MMCNHYSCHTAALNIKFSDLCAGQNNSPLPATNTALSQQGMHVVKQVPILTSLPELKHGH
jgi:hypothetical protein